MKRFIFIILLNLTVIYVTAQIKNGKISVATTIGTSVTMNQPSFIPFTWQVLGYYNPTERWSIGAGTGLLVYEKMLIPVYGDVRFLIIKERKFTPFVEFAAGYSFSPTKDAQGGVFVNPSIGVQYGFKNKIKLFLEMGYELQKLEWLKRQTDNYFLKEFSEKITHHSISFKIGLRF